VVSNVGLGPIEISASGSKKIIRVIYYLGNRRVPGYSWQPYSRSYNEWNVEQSRAGAPVSVDQALAMHAWLMIISFASGSSRHRHCDYYLCIRESLDTFFFFFLNGDVWDVRSRFQLSRKNWC